MLVNFIEDNFIMLTIFLTIVIFIILLKNDFITNKVNFYLSEYKNIHFILRLFIWVALLKFVIKQAYKSYYTFTIYSASTAYDVLNLYFWLVFPIFIILVIILFLILAFKILDPLKNEQNSLIKPFILFVFWTIALYLTVFFLHKYYYTFIIYSTSKAYYIILSLYFWLMFPIFIILTIILLSTLAFKILDPLKNEQNSLIKPFILFVFWTIALYLTVFFLHKYYYTFIIYSANTAHFVVSLYFWLIFPIFVILTIILFLTLAFKILNPLKNKKNSLSKPLILFVFWTIALYLTVFFLYKCYYTAIIYSSNTAYYVLNLYFWLMFPIFIILGIILLSTLAFKIFDLLKNEQNSLIKPLILFVFWTIALYLTVFFLHKYYYTAIIYLVDTTHYVLNLYFWLALITFLLPKIMELIFKAIPIIIKPSNLYWIALLLTVIILFYRFYHIFF
jgi:hypothetical protein